MNIAIPSLILIPTSFLLYNSFMANTNVNKWGQSHHWEEACIKTRRNLNERKRRISFLEIGRKDRVLDLGCGDGLNVKVLRKMGIRDVIGIDISPELLSIARKENRDNKFYLASAEKLPFKANYFDVVFVDSVFHHFMKYDRAIEEIKRVLKNGGKLCFIEPHRSILRSFYDFISTSFVANFMPSLKRRGKSYLGEIRFMKHWLSTEEIFYKTLSKMGFREKTKRSDVLSIIATYEVSKK